VTGGGAAFRPPGAGREIVVAPGALRRVGPAPVPGNAIPPAEPTVRLLVEGDDGRLLMRIDANAAWDVVMALVRERSEAGLPEADVRTAAGSVVTPAGGGVPGPRAFAYGDGVAALVTLLF
jgi:hypothetical protein